MDKIYKINGNKPVGQGQPIYVGLDVHKKSWSVSVYSSQGEYKSFSQPPEADKLVNYLKRTFPGSQYYSVYEAGYCGFWIHDQLQQQGVDSMVVNPADVPTKQKEHQHKRDRIDCRKLARNLCHGEMEGIYIPSPAMREDRTLVRTRYAFVKKRTRCKNQIKGMLLFYGLHLTDEQAYAPWSADFIKWIEGIRMERDSGNTALKAHLEELAYLRQLINKVNQEVLKLARSEEYAVPVKVLKSAPGISTLSAMILLTELCDMARFASLDSLCSYVGLIPAIKSSGETEYVRGITPRRNAYLRWILIEAAWVAVRKDPAMMMAFNEYCKRMRKNRAIVKIARKLLNRIRYILKHQTPYAPCVAK